MNKLGLIVLIVGGLIVMGSFGMDTAPEGTHNIGLLQQQMMVFQVGGLLALIGVLLTILALVTSRLEQAGILPPGYERSMPVVSPGTVK